MAAERSPEIASLFVLSEEATGPARPLATLRMALAAVEEFTQARSPDDQLRRLQYSSQFPGYLPDEVLRSLPAEALQDEAPRIRGEMCYSLGRSGRTSLIPELRLLKDDSNPWVQKQAKESLGVFEKATPTASDFQQLQHQAKRLLKEVKAEGGLVQQGGCQSLNSTFQGGAWRHSGDRSIADSASHQLLQRCTCTSNNEFQVGPNCCWYRSCAFSGNRRFPARRKH